MIPSDGYAELAPEDQATLRRFERRQAALKGWAYRRRDWDQYLALQDHGSRLYAFVRIEARLDGPDYWRLFREVWTMTELPHLEGDLVPALLGKHPEDRRAIMAEAERAYLDGLGEVLRVYRGVGSRDYKGVSWTLDHGRAVWFAQRFPGSDPCVLHGHITKADVIAYLTDRQEDEILCLPECVDIDRVESIPSRFDEAGA